MPECYAIRESFLREYLAKIYSATSEQITLARDLDLTPRSIIGQGDGYPIIYIRGTLVDDPDPLAAFFGYQQTSYQQILEAIENIKESDSDKVVLMIDSGGGYVAPGLDDVWKAIRALSETKEVVAVNAGMIASAAYWIASAANLIVSTSQLTEQGSIGVYASFTDWTEYDKKLGIKEVRIVSSNAPLKNLPTDDDRLVEQIKERLDNVERVFLSRISEGRNIPVADIAKNFGKGAILSNEQAEKVGMIDGVVDSIDKFFSAGTTASAQDKPTETRGDQVPSLKELLADNPEARAEYETARTTALDMGKEAIQKQVKAAIPFIGNATYPKSISELAKKVALGEATQEQLETAVEIVDEIRAEEEKRLAEAADKDNPPTPAKPADILNPSTYAQTGVISTLEDLKQATRKAS